MKKVLKNVTLVLGGVVLGVGISFAGDISAATSKLLGGKVGKVMTVTLDDKSIGEAPVIGGTSYVPVRTTANELGLEVAVEGSEIKLTTPDEETVVTTPQGEKDPVETVDNSEDIKKIEQEIETVQRKIFGADRTITDKGKMLEDAKLGKASGAVGMDSLIQAYEEEISLAKQSKAEQEKILSDLESQLAALK